MKKETSKKKFLQTLESSRGIIATACKAAGISRSTFYTWKDQDEEFRQKAEDILEAQVDFVESKLLRRIDAEETTAIIFYLKAKGKKRGWNEKYDTLPDRESPVKVRPYVDESKPEDNSFWDKYAEEHPLTKSDYLELALAAPDDKDGKTISWRSEEEYKKDLEIIEQFKKNLKKTKEEQESFEQSMEYTNRKMKGLA